MDGSKASPYYKIDKNSGKIIDSKIPENMSTLSAKQIKTLVDTAIKIQLDLGYYQDIGWTIQGEELFIL